MINSKNINDLRSDVKLNCEAWIKECKKQGLNVLVTQTLRDNEYQAYLYSLGRTKKGSIVTNSKTTTFHGKGLAFDFCKNVKGHEYDDLSFFKKAANIAKNMGFSWGGDWKSFVDRPHIQWDNHGKFTNTMIRNNVLPPKMPIIEEDMDISRLTDEQCYEILLKAANYSSKLPASAWAEDSIVRAKNLGITDGSAPQTLATRQEVIAMILRTQGE